ncbi:MAG TPA: MFS transporter [Candidatus Hydrogenedentes bacterium]|nr:MFS transporter [Candidatus Hydrogenedentota bacterium]HNT86447.1 MFS transporter [Candidatus Hydrogenedentota bacterium]
MSTPEPQAAAAARLSPEARRAVGIVFLTLFIDLVSFSIIFPLFPNMLTYYREVEQGAGLFGWLYGATDRLTQLAGSPEGDWGVMVLFGGVLGALYSFLQFLFAPILGRVSDRIGRRPVLLIGVGGMAISHLLWVFAGRFWLFLLSRVIGGMMSANIATATAVVADVTDARSRPRGMALIGMAFGLGFIIGPALGGLSAMIDLTRYWPDLGAAGINPFSTPALIATGLSLVNLLQLALRFRESLPKGNGAPDTTQRTANLFVLLRLRGNAGTGGVNLTYFLFFAVFSGMEFTLTFLTVDRLGYAPRENGLMFLYVGLVLALMQGSYVRVFAARLGPKRMSGHGILLAAPGLLLIGLAAISASGPLLFLGLGLLAAGVAQAAPCLTALASLYAPPSDQGRVLGVFRSVGALARAVGPLAACLLYWGLGAELAYVAAGIFMLAPLWIARRLPDPPAHDKNPTIP